MSKKQEEVIKRIKSTIDKVRPFLQRDGGDVIFDDFIDGVVYINMLGACEDCIYIDNTIKEGIETILLEEVPEVKAVKLGSEKPETTSKK